MRSYGCNTLKCQSRKSVCGGGDVYFCMFLCSHRFNHYKNRNIQASLLDQTFVCSYFLSLRLWKSYYKFLLLFIYCPQRIRIWDLICCMNYLMWGTASRAKCMSLVYSLLFSFYLPGGLHMNKTCTTLWTTTQRNTQVSNHITIF